MKNSYKISSSVKNRYFPPQGDPPQDVRKSLKIKNGVRPQSLPSEVWAFEPCSTHAPPVPVETLEPLEPEQLESGCYSLTH